MKPNDICFYMSITKEENSSVMVDNPSHQNLPDEDLNLVNNANLNRKLSFRRPSMSVKPPTDTNKETKPMIKCNQKSSI